MIVIFLVKCSEGDLIKNKNMNENIENYSRDWTQHCWKLFQSKDDSSLSDIEKDIILAGIANLSKIIDGKPSKPEKEFCAKIIGDEFKKLIENN